MGVSRVLRVLVCLLVLLIGLAFAGYANELVNPVLTTLDRVVLLIGYIIGDGAVTRWLANRTFWDRNATVSED